MQFFTLLAKKKFWTRNIRYLKGGGEGDCRRHSVKITDIYPQDFQQKFREFDTFLFELHSTLQINSTKYFASENEFSIFHTVWDRRNVPIFGI